MKTPEHKLYRVTLLIESPDTLEPPNGWDWNLIVNPEGTKQRERAPVVLYYAEQTKLGNA
jgi:hypothetical protein